MSLNSVKRWEGLWNPKTLLNVKEDQRLAGVYFIFFVFSHSVLLLIVFSCYDYHNGRVFFLSSHRLSQVRRVLVTLPTWIALTLSVSSFRVSFMSNQKQQKPTLTGQRFKTRKRGLFYFLRWPGQVVTYFSEKIKPLLEIKINSHWRATCASLPWTITYEMPLKRFWKHHFTM